MDPVSFTVPGVARGQGRPRATIRGKHAAVYKDAKSASYENLVKLAAEAAMAGRVPMSGPVRLLLNVRCAPPASASRKVREAMLSGASRPAKKPDLSNITKAVEDGCNGVAFIDDAQIVSLCAAKIYAETPGVDVSIEPLGETI